MPFQLVGPFGETPMSYRSAVRALLVVAAGSVLALGPTGIAAADATSTASHAVFVVKDLGGGAYWNVTTGTMFVVDNAANTFGSTLTAGEQLLATAVDDGRDTLLLVNGTVLVPVQNTAG